MTRTTRGTTALVGAVIATTLCTGAIADEASAQDADAGASSPDVISHPTHAVRDAHRDAERLTEPSEVRADQAVVSPAWPVDGTLTSEFGSRDGRLHRGIDVAAPDGTPIRSVRDGVVTFAGVRRGYGNTVEIDHGDGHETLSAHQSELLVERGERVRRGQVIGRVGSTGSSTGPHLHFEYTVAEHELDPLALLPAA